SSSFPSFPSVQKFYLFRTRSYMLAPSPPSVAPGYIFVAPGYTVELCIQSPTVLYCSRIRTQLRSKSMKTTLPFLRDIRSFISNLRLCSFLLLSPFLLSATHAATSTNPITYTPYQVRDRGQNHITFQRFGYETNRSGRVI